MPKLLRLILEILSFGIWPGDCRVVPIQSGLLAMTVGERFAMTVGERFAMTVGEWLAMVREFLLVVKKAGKTGYNS
jgi:hypothetical protein